MYGNFPYIRTMSSVKNKLSRFDTRLPEEQKLFFEKAARLGGFRSLTDFILFSAQEKANEIIRENEQIIAGERDAKIFFNAVSKPAKPSEKLKKAYNEYLKHS